MQYTPKAFILLIVGFLFIGVIGHYGYQSYRHQEITNMMKKSAQVVATESVDHSLRVDEDIVLITERVFEQKFKERFQELAGSFSIASYSFNYLKDGDTYKAINIKVVDDQGSPYQITFVTDFNNQL